MLTRKQHELLTFIDEHLRRTGFSPSFEEMKEALQLKSKSGIHRLISALEERGFLQRRHHRARALEVVRMPGSLPREADVPFVAPALPASQAAGLPRPAGGDERVVSFPKARAQAKEQRDDIVALPLYGKIAAGAPIEALQDPGSFIDIPAAMLGAGEHYAVRVSGDSMVEAGILDGDTAIICTVDHAQNGEIVVALVDDQEVTLKRLQRQGANVALEPANALYETRILPVGRVRVQGRLVALLRQY